MLVNGLVIIMAKACACDCTYHEYTVNVQETSLIGHYLLSSAVLHLCTWHAFDIHDRDRPN